jgi:glycosyltransferase involved in cell wall biosynthesis
VVPLGADELDVGSKDLSGGMRLLYVGNLSRRRRMEDTIRGLALFVRAHGPNIVLSYDIVGDWYGNERQELERLAEESGLSGTVVFHGFVHHAQLGPLYGRCNVGVSYIPVTPYYDVQPPTKTFEYLLAGMPVIATDTTENRLVVNDANGVLAPDSAEAFCAGLWRLWNRRASYDSESVKASCRDFTWERIVRDNLAPYLRRASEEVLRAQKVRD